MSYAKFKKDLNDFAKDRKKRGLTEKIPLEVSLAVVRDKWLIQNKIKELIAFIHTNWDSGNCDEFIAPLESLLIRTHQVETYKFLWAKIIKHRIRNLWTSIKELKSAYKIVNLNEIDSIDVSGLNSFSTDISIKQRVAFRRYFVIAGLIKMKQGLTTLHDKDGANQIQSDIEYIKILKRPKLVMFPSS